MKTNETDTADRRSAPAICSACGVDWEQHGGIQQHCRAIAFLAAHHCEPAPAQRIREGLYICDVRVNAKNLSHDYRGEGITAVSAMLSALTVAANSWPNTALSKPHENA